MAPLDHLRWEGRLVDGALRGSLKQSYQDGSADKVADANVKNPPSIPDYNHNNTKVFNNLQLMF